MSFFQIVKKTFSNKVFLYVSSRYFIYFIQFLTSLFIAQKLGPQNLGVWGYYLLIYCYFTYITLGIPNSLNILTIQNKDNKELKQNIFDSSFVSVLVLCSLICIFCFSYYSIDDVLINSVHIGANILLIGLIAILSHINTLYATIYRINNKLFGMAFHQSATQIFVLISVIFFNEENLLFALLLSYFLGELSSIIIFKVGRQVSFENKHSLVGVKMVIKKGYYLFLYNTGFYFILISTRTIIKSNYSLDDFGYFTFAYTIANSVLLLLQAFTSLVFPKLIDKFKTDEKKIVKEVSNLLLDTNVTLSYALVLLAIPLFPVLLHFMPQYKETFSVISYTALAVLLYNNAVYGSYLMSHNKEKFMAVVALTALVLNILVSLFAIRILNISYEYVVFAMMLAYFVYSYMITLYSQKLLGENIGLFSVVKVFFPYRLMIPYFIELIIIFTGINKIALILNFILFAILNRKQFIEIFSVIRIIIINPQVIDIKHN